MKIALIQSGNSGFFPRFFDDLSFSARKRNDIIYAFLPNTGLNRKTRKENYILWGSKFNWFIHHFIYTWTGIQDVWSLYSTFCLYRKLKRYNPDLINLHVVNDCVLCFPIFVRMLNKLNKPVVWTFHDTRTITARCASFEEDQCFQWQLGCKLCTEHSIYQKSILNNVNLQWKLYRNWFNKINHLTIVTPSHWLAHHVSNSFLKEKKCIIIHNGIDTSSFSKPSTLKYNLPFDENVKVILGVSAGWQHRKGLDSMIWLSNNLPSNYSIVLVGGIKEGLEHKIPKKILCLPKTSSKAELISLYQRANVYVNPTLADNFPTVNIEALGAGTPVITFNTGGAAESIDSSCGISVTKGDNEALLHAILEVCNNPDKYSRANCIERSHNFSLSQFDKYLRLFHELYEKNI